MTYEKDTQISQFAARLKQNRERDIRSKMTNCGPHRDDLCFAIREVDIRRFGSQGQQRTAALSLKLAEIEIVKQSVKDTPVLLLDDVLSELDSRRQRYLLESIHDIQTMITGTGVDDFVENNFKINRLFQVTDGTVQSRRINRRFFMSAEYGADQIQILEGLEAVRKSLVCTLEAPRREVSITWFMR